MISTRLDFCVKIKREGAQGLQKNRRKRVSLYGKLYVVSSSNNVVSDRFRSLSPITSLGRFGDLLRFSFGLGLHRLALARFHLLYSVFPVALVPRVQDAVPEDKERLREVGLDAPCLVMDVVVGGVVARDVLQGVPGQGVAAVVVNGLDGREAEEEETLAGGHARKKEANTGAEGVEEETLKGVVIQSAVGVRNVEAVVSRMEGS